MSYSTQVDARDALRSSTWIVHAGDFPVARTASASAATALDKARGLLVRLGLTLPECATILARVRATLPPSFRSTAGPVTTAAAGKELSRDVGEIVSGVVRGVRSEWSGFAPRCQKLDFASPTNFRVLLAGDSGYCGVKGAPHRNAAGTDKASFVVGMRDGLRPNRVKHQCKHSACEGRTEWHNMQPREIAAIEVTSIRETRPVSTERVHNRPRCDACGACPLSCRAARASSSC